MDTTVEHIQQMVSASLVELFAIDPARITPDARLGRDLDIDSIDVVDLIDRLERQTRRKVSADDFRSVQTVGDLVQAIQRLLRS